MKNNSDQQQHHHQHKKSSHHRGASKLDEDHNNNNIGNNEESTAGTKRHISTCEQSGVIPKARKVKITYHDGVGMHSYEEVAGSENGPESNNSDANGNNDVENKNNQNAVSTAAATAATTATAAATARRQKKTTTSSFYSIAKFVFSPVITLFTRNHHEECHQDKIDSPISNQEEDCDDDFDPYRFMKALTTMRIDWNEINLRTAVPPRGCGLPSVSLVLDLDETLVHASLVPLPNAHITFVVQVDYQDHQIWVKMRPGCMEFLEKMRSMFEVIVFTASQQAYADRLLDIIDPKRNLIHHRVFRDSCLLIQENYIKELSVLGRDLSKVIIVDNSPHAFGLNVDNGIPIASWFGDQNDEELHLLAPLLETLSTQDDVRPIIRNTFRLHDRIANA